MILWGRREEQGTVSFLVFTEVLRTWVELCAISLQLKCMEMLKWKWTCLVLIESIEVCLRDLQICSWCRLCSRWHTALPRRLAFQSMDPLSCNPSLWWDVRVWFHFALWWPLSLKPQFQPGEKSKHAIQSSEIRKRWERSLAIFLSLDPLDLLLDLHTHWLTIHDDFVSSDMATIRSYLGSKGSS